MNDMHFAFCVNDGYVPYICVTIKSILENHKGHNIIIHVLSDYISLKKKDLLDDVISGCSEVDLQIHIVDDTILRGLKDTWSIYTWYRVLLPQVLSNDVHKVMYLDADVLVAGDITDLFQLDMVNKAIAGTIDFQSKDPSTYIRCGYDQEKEYVCAGVMMMNLDYWREHNIASQVIRWGRDNNDRIRFPDQDAINYVCCDSKILLPLRYDIVDGFFYDDYYYQNYSQELRECIETPAIIHYAGQAPWVVELSNHLMQDEWVKYNKTLIKPVRRIYQSKGILKVKVILYRMFHSRVNQKLNRQDVIKKLKG